MTAGVIKRESKRKISKFIKKAIEKEVFPGAVLGIKKQDEVLWQSSFGYLSKKAETEVELDTVYDLASLTKVLVTTTAIMQLVEEGIINLADQVERYFPDAAPEFSRITLWHLLTHTSGLPAIVELWEELESKEEAKSYLLNLEPFAKIEEEVRYSDPNFLLLGFIVEKVSGLKLDRYAREYIFKPLNLKRTGFNPKEQPLNLPQAEIAPTEYCDYRGYLPQGEVHDKNCYFLGGASGQAGLFSCLPDLIQLITSLLRGSKILKRITFVKTTADCTPPQLRSRGIGWDKGGDFNSSAGFYFGPKSFGHTGFTGTSLWSDPELDLTVIFLSNRVNYGRENKKHIAFRPRLHNLIVSEVLASS